MESFGMHYKVRDLGVIGDQSTAAFVARDGNIVWFCPERFDKPSLLARLLAPNGGHWRIDIPGSPQGKRFYLSDSAILITTFSCSGSEITLTDWMPVGEDVPRGAICRMISAGPRDLTIVFAPSPNYGANAPSLEVAAEGVHVEDNLTLFASHKLSLIGDAVHMTLPAGEGGWTVLVPRYVSRPDTQTVLSWRKITLEHWSKLAAKDRPSDFYGIHVRDSLRAIRLLTHAASGGMIAAVTTSLPEVPMGQRNYDYRYVWLRDAGMIASAVTRSTGTAFEASRFLDFIASTNIRSNDIFLPPALSLDGKAMPEEMKLQALPGHGDQQRAVAGNNAHSQLQLDGLGNILLVAKLSYGLSREQPHFVMIAEIADFLAVNWQRPDHGPWEEQEERQYTNSKAIMTCGLEYIAEYGSVAQAARWRAAANCIRAYIAANCITESGAYAAVAGGDAVDVSAALLPVWGYCEAETPEMLVTICEIERDLADGDMYRRRLEEFDSAKEGVFLAGTLWVAQYWIVRKESTKARRIINAVLAYANDLGFFAEEGDTQTGDMLGNFPQSFVHAAFVGTIFDLAQLIDGTDTASKEVQT